jgi:hypothetical protein
MKSQKGWTTVHPFFRWQLPQINYELTLRILFQKKGVICQNHAFFLLMV